jgi:hypothetical protein
MWVSRAGKGKASSSRLGADIVSFCGGSLFFFALAYKLEIVCVGDPAITATATGLNHTFG